ncbi:YobI family P-loop NTPase [Saccharophagus degradans]|uniref:YobI-like P-loop NTPase domain-containing protein n=1 Tax=Saccharophagus degradans TaxID=86304 RepID=A0AAW7X730_9GAMM|nr:hypothetical protein [Saccharophagus degradans]MDO6423407.1 hypothetical protein [Saccharophagus degradans]MDO6606812.1 hypothetical protein [Saccharophagus degradans]
MIKNIVSMVRWLVVSLDRIAFLLEKKYPPADIQSKFVDLAPTDEADNDGIYSKAISYATNNTRVSNIALTGPYGSGKSSIIQSFLKKYRRPTLLISLAAFVPEADSNSGGVNRQEIERSILQQMLYGADANKLPLSRFKRIQSPGVWSFVKSLYITVGTLALLYVFHERVSIISGDFFDPPLLTNWFRIVILFLAATFLWVILHYFYVASFGFSLKSISLKDVEIKPACDDQGSILNRHLDEIVYFFQSTSYDLVIIEDLDRFNNSEIFVTLREINSLVNENIGVRRRIRFLYALRDDMFVNTDRTKFFEFIIPVIPIINTSNSIDMVLEQGRRLDLDDRLDRQFLREVSRYLNDLRLIQNVFNEYVIYVANLETDGENILDENKLLAVLIYKNVYPRDFERLHRGEGILADIFNLQNELVRLGEEKYRADIAEIEVRLENAERQTPMDTRELQKIYAMTLIEKLSPSVVKISSNQRKWVEVPRLIDHEAFEELLEGIIFTRDHQSNLGRVDVTNLQNEVDSIKTYRERKEEIDSKSADNRKKYARKVQEIRSKITALRTTKLNELLRLNVDRVQQVFERFDNNDELARYLILEGYLDDTYYHYTSLFHSGRLSPNDNKYLILIRAFNTPEPSFPIDNPKEVIAAMRDEDFCQSYVLNIKLVDCLLGEPNYYSEQTKKLFNFLSVEFNSCEDFFVAYYSSGSYVEKLLSNLIDAWGGAVTALIKSTNNIVHVAHSIVSLPESELKNLAENFEKLPKFVSFNLAEILSHLPELKAERLACLNFKVRDLASIKEHTEIIGFMLSEGLVEITIDNLEYVYEAIIGRSDIQLLREMNYTAIRSAKNETILRWIEHNFDHYFFDVLLQLEKNSKEDSSAILAIVKNSTLDESELREFLGRQESVLSTLDGVPERLYAMLFELSLIEPAWNNCIEFIKAKAFKADSLARYLDQEFIRAAILQSEIPSDSDSQGLIDFLLSADLLSDVAYREYMQAIPKSISAFPESLKDTKLRILIDERKVIFSKKNFDALDFSIDLQIHFVAVNIDKYLAEPDCFKLDDDFRGELLRSEISSFAKGRIVELIDLNSFLSQPFRAGLIVPVIEKANFKALKINAEVAEYLIEHCESIKSQISLLNKCQPRLSDEQVRKILAKLPSPYNEIKIGFSKPRLKNSPENLELVRWLDDRNIISSWSVPNLINNDINVNLYRR